MINGWCEGGVNALMMFGCYWCSYNGLKCGLVAVVSVCDDFASF